MSIEDQTTCDGSTITIEPITISVDADVSTEELKGKKNSIKCKRTNRTQPKLDACVSKYHRWTCDAIKTMDSNVICAEYTQTNEDGGWC